MSRTRYRLSPRPAPALLSLVIPMFNEQEVLPILRRELTRFCDSLPYPVEVVLVNDGSSDETTILAAEWAGEDERIRVLDLARNFGHQIAVTAGLDYCTGDAVVIMDADLQDPPDVIPRMVEAYTNGYDVVYGKRESREGESVFKRFTAWAFYRLMQALIHRDLPADVGDFRLISRRCLLALQQMRETHRFLRGMVTWVGFAQTEVRYKRESRAAGQTKYPVSKMLHLAWTAAISFSPAPLRLSFYLGMLLFLAGITQALNALIRVALGLYLVPGWASMVVVNCLVGGGILVCIGVLGEYVGRIFEEVKGRPLYLVADCVNRAETHEQPASVHGVELKRLNEGLLQEVRTRQEAK